MLPWSEYQGLVELKQRTKYGQLFETGVELRFMRGAALLPYRPITNPQEVMVGG